MTRSDRVCFTIYLTALGLWAGVIAMTAAAAAVTFPTMKAVDPIVPSLSESSRPHWMFVAGKVVNGVFTISNAAQAVCALLAISTLVMLIRSPQRAGDMRRSIASISTAGAVAVLASYLLLLWPRMRTNLHAYWDNLNAGRLEAAKSAQDLFNADHPLASMLLQVLLLLVLIALISGAWKATRRTEPQR